MANEMNLLNWTFFREVAIPQDIANLLINSEQPVSAFATIRDVAVFTDKRLIVKDAQGLTGKKVEIYSLPYSSILMWSTENAGKIFDLNAEVELWTKVGKIKINFILKFMEKKGLINLKTGKGGFDFKSGNISYRLTFGDLGIKGGRKYWVVTNPSSVFIKDSHSRFPYKDQNWYIDGETGQVYTEEEFEKRDKSVNLK